MSAAGRESVVSLKWEVARDALEKVRTWLLANVPSVRLTEPEDVTQIAAETLAISQEIMARHAKTFNLAARLLPKARRRDAAVVYAFCRTVDDAADEAEDVSSARLELAALEAELLGDAVPGPMVAAFLDVAARRQVPIDAALELIRGVASDLDEVRVADDGELLRYCYRVAGTVGLMMCGVLGVDEPDALPHAVDLGVGMQLTNICRDVLEDAELGRTYLPEARLRQKGVLPERLRGQPEDVARVVLDLLELADAYYDSGRHGLRYIPARPRAAIAAAAGAYRAIGVKLRKRGGDALAGRTVVSQAVKLSHVAVAASLAWLSPLAWRRAHDAALHVHLRGLPGTHGG